MPKPPVLLYAPEGMTPSDDLRDTVHYLCHRMFVGGAIWGTEDGFTRLKAEYLHAVCRDYRKGLDWLLTNGFIETDGFYVEGMKATGYRWTSGQAAVRVAYTNVFERMEKVEAMKNQATEDLAADLATVCQKLGVSEKRVSVRQR